ncbi:MAG: GrdX family protein [Clostridia bacterium]
MSSYIIVTNNPLVIKHYQDESILKEKKYLEVLETVRDHIHQGHRLLTHPLAGSVKPNQNPYRTVLISKNAGSLDFNSLSLIENAIKVAEKMLNDKNTPEWSQAIKEDFQFVDKSHIDSAIKNIK